MNVLHTTAFCMPWHGLLSECDREGGERERGSREGEQGIGNRGREGRKGREGIGEGRESWG